MIRTLKYGNTKTYIINGDYGILLIDTDWAGTLKNFFKGIKEMGLQVSDIKYLLMTHYHPDHMGIAQDLVDLGIELLVIDKQIDYIHFSDEYLSKDKNDNFKPINENLAKIITCKESREMLRKVGIHGEIIHTPGHSDDSISVIIDNEAAIVGDLYPINTASGYDNRTVTKSWDKILSYNVKLAYYAHAKEDNIKDINSVNEISF